MVGRYHRNAIRRNEPVLGIEMTLIYERQMVVNSKVFRYARTTATLNMGAHDAIYGQNIHFIT